MPYPESGGGAASSCCARVSASQLLPCTVVCLHNNKDLLSLQGHNDNHVCSASNVVTQVSALSMYHSIRYCEHCIQFGFRPLIEAVSHRWLHDVQVPDVLAAYEPHFEGFEVATEGSWACVTAVRRLEQPAGS